MLCCIGKLPVNLRSYNLPKDALQMFTDLLSSSNAARISSACGTTPCQPSQSDHFPFEFQSERIISSEASLSSLARI